MQSGQDVIGKTVVSLDSGKIIGSVKDLYFDAPLNTLVALYLGREGLLQRATKVVRFSEIAVLGDDVILVHSSESVQDKNTFEDAGDWVSRSELHGRKITTSGGTPIGRIDDITLGDNGMVLDFTLIWTQVGGPIGDSLLITRRAVLDAGHELDVMTVDLTTAEGHRQPSPT